MTTFVVDTSALAKAFLEQGECEAFRDWLEETQIHGAQLTAPALLAFELGRVIERNFLETEKDEMLAQMLERTLRSFRFDAVKPALVFAAARHNLTYSDACFVALAKTAKATLVTSDAAMQKGAVALGVKVKRFG